MSQKLGIGVSRGSRRHAIEIGIDDIGLIPSDGFRLGGSMQQIVVGVGDELGIAGRGLGVGVSVGIFRRRQ